MQLIQLHQQFLLITLKAEISDKTEKGTVRIILEKSFKGIITKGVGGLYGVRPYDLDWGGEREAYMCRARGAFRHAGITPLPGDIVTVIPETEGTEEAVGVIDEIEERKSCLIRPALANLSHLFIVVPAARPAPDLKTADKLICAAEDKGIVPVIIVTKSDADFESAESIKKNYSLGSFSVFCTNHEGEGDSDIFDYIANTAAKLKEEKAFMCAAFAGVSGAGKSTLMTRLFPSLNLKTGDVSRKIQRGRHTTRHAELYSIEIENTSCYIADTPGFSMVDFATYNFVEAESLPYTFREFAPLMGQCKYTKCTHTKEEGCAVLEKVKSGEISPLRHQSYISLLEEIKKNPPWKRK